MYVLLYLTVLCNSLLVQIELLTNVCCYDCVQSGVETPSKCQGAVGVTGKGLVSPVTCKGAGLVSPVSGKGAGLVSPVSGKGAGLVSPVSGKGAGLSVPVNGAESFITSSPHPSKHRGKKRGGHQSTVVCPCIC